MITAEELARCGPVRIGELELFRVAVPMHEPFRISSGEVSLKEALLVRVRDGDAFSDGWSEEIEGGFRSGQLAKFEAAREDESAT